MRPSGMPPGYVDRNKNNTKGLNADHLESLLLKPEFNTIAKEFVHAGKEATDLLMRTYFKDRKELNSAILFIKKCEEFDIPEGLTLIQNLFAGATSIGGAARKDLLQAIVGQLSTDIYKTSPYHKSLFGKDTPAPQEGL